MPEKVHFQPKQYHTITANLVCQDAAKAVEFYKNVFKATNVRVMNGPNNLVMHAELTIGDTLIFVNDTMMGKTVYLAAGETAPTYLHIYVENVDETFKKALAEGATEDMAPQDMFWGDRWGKLRDPFGQQWGIATHIEDVAPEDMQKRMQSMMAQGASAGAGS